MIDWFNHHPIMKALRTDASTNLGKLILRLGVGAVFIYHGYPKLVAPTAVMAVGFFTKIGVPAPGFFAPFVGVVELVGGICLILGLITRFWAAGLVIDMAVAILGAKGLAKWVGIEFELTLLVSSLLLFLSGAGAYSVDSKLVKK